MSTEKVVVYQAQASLETGNRDDPDPSDDWNDRDISAGVP